MTLQARIRLLTAVAAVALVAAGCGGSASASVCTDDGLTIPVPDALAGLAARPSDDARQALLQEKEETQTYICDASVFELREGPTDEDELIAVLEIIRMTDDARIDDIDFQRSIAHDIGASSRVPDQVDGTFVWRTSLNQQALHVWFQQRFMQVLIVRELTQDGDAVIADPILRAAVALRAQPAEQQPG